MTSKDSVFGLVLGCFIGLVGLGILVDSDGKSSGLMGILILAAGIYIINHAMIWRNE